MSAAPSVPTSSFSSSQLLVMLVKSRQRKLTLHSLFTYLLTVCPLLQALISVHEKRSPGLGFGSAGRTLA